MSTTPPEAASQFGKQSQYERPAQPAELAPVYVFLASPESGYITGEVVGVTGGKPISWRRPRVAAGGSRPPSGP